MVVRIMSDNEVKLLEKEKNLENEIQSIDEHIQWNRRELRKEKGNKEYCKELRENIMALNAEKREKKIILRGVKGRRISERQRAIENQKFKKKIARQKGKEKVEKQKRKEKMQQRKQLSDLKEWKKAGFTREQAISFKNRGISLNRAIYYRENAIRIREQKQPIELSESRRRTGENF